MGTSTTFLIVTLGLAVATAWVLRTAFPELPFAVEWLTAITIMTFLTFGYDKAVAGSESTRVPELVLLTLVFLGGTLGGLAGMRIFRHKSAKGGFQVRFWGAIVIQLAVIAGWWYWRESGPAPEGS